MGKHFGNLQRLKGVIFYCLSPQELNPLKGMLFPGVFNNLRVVAKEVIYIIPGALITWAVYNHILEIQDAKLRKNPADYENET